LNILAIGAHFDDIELGCGGALAKHVAEGDTVYVYVATKSGYTSYNNIEIRSDSIAIREGESAMLLLGAILIQGDFKTLDVEFVDRLNVDILKIVEGKEIDTAYIHWRGDIHHDHASVSKASLHSCRHVNRILMYRSNWYHSSLDFRGNFYIDISNYMDKKRQIILEHKSELERTNKKWIEFWDNEATNCGLKVGVRYAEVFEVVKWVQM
jgi:LmbE family N-acetylglucosaminyl deacetylase